VRLDHGGMSSPEHLGVRPEMPRPTAQPTGRGGGWTTPWMILMMAFPGTALGILCSAVASAPWFGEAPSATRMADAEATVLSSASLLLVAGLVSLAVSRRWLALALAGPAAALLCLVALTAPERAPLRLATSEDWTTAWSLPTSWAVLLIAVLAVGRRLRPTLHQRLSTAA
jgi:hypothetical protein